MKCLARTSTSQHSLASNQWVTYIFSFLLMTTILITDRRLYMYLFLVTWHQKHMILQKRHQAPGDILFIVCSDRQHRWKTSITPVKMAMCTLQGNCTLISLVIVSHFVHNTVKASGDFINSYALLWIFLPIAINLVTRSFILVLNGLVESTVNWDNFTTCLSQLFLVVKPSGQNSEIDLCENINNEKVLD